MKPPGQICCNFGQVRRSAELSHGVDLRQATIELDFAAEESVIESEPADTVLSLGRRLTSLAARAHCR